MRASTSSPRETSARTNAAVPPAARISRSTSAPRSAPRDVRTTRAPRAQRPAPPLARCRSFHRSPEPLCLSLVPLCFSGAGACGRTREKQFAFAGIAGQRRRALELQTGFREAADLGEKIAADARQQVIILKHRVRTERIDKREARLRAGRHRNRDRAVQLHYGRRRELRQPSVEFHNAGPVGLLGGSSARVTGGDGGLQCIAPEGGGELLGASERRQAAADEKPIPQCPVLIEKENGRSRGTHTRSGTRSLNLHERHKAQDLSLFRNQLSQD